MEDFGPFASPFPDNPGEFQNLDQYSKEVADFEIAPGVGFRWTSPISSFFQRSLTLMLLPPLPFFGFMYSSTPLPLLPFQLDEEALAELTESMMKEVLEQHESKEQEEEKDKSWYFLSGEARFDGSVQGMHLQKFNKHWSLHSVACSGLPDQSLLISSLQYDSDNFTSKLSYASINNIVVCSHHHNITRHFTLGGELGYNLAEKQPNLSVGCRYSTKNSNNRYEESQWTTSLSMLGHLTTTFTTPISSTVLMSTRYEINTNDLKADFGVGVMLLPSQTYPFRARARFDTNKGIAFHVDSALPYFGGISLGFLYGTTTGPSFGLFVES